MSTTPLTCRHVGCFSNTLYMCFCFHNLLSDDLSSNIKSKAFLFAKTCTSFLTHIHLWSLFLAIHTTYFWMTSLIWMGLQSIFSTAATLSQKLLLCLVGRNLPLPSMLCHLDTVLFFLSINVSNDNRQSLNLKGSPVDTAGSVVGRWLALITSANTLTKASSELLCSWIKDIEVTGTWGVGCRLEGQRAWLMFDGNW